MNKSKTHDTMSPEAQRTAIAEACGWKKMNWNGVTVYGSPTHGFRVWESKHQDSIMSYKGQAGERIPDYLNDLNACREFEEVLNSPKYMQFHAFNNYAAMLCEMCKHEYNAIAATAPQRCEAFLRTIDKWTNDR